MLSKSDKINKTMKIKSKSSFTKNYDSVLDPGQREHGRVEGTNIYEQKYRKDNQ